VSCFNTLYHGEASDAADILDGDQPPDTIEELRVALTNALRRISRLEAQVANLRKDLNE
jgi:hypothetical protein